MDGIAILKKIAARPLPPPVVMQTASSIGRLTPLFVITLLYLAYIKLQIAEHGNIHGVCGGTQSFIAPVKSSV